MVWGVRSHPTVWCCRFPALSVDPSFHIPGSKWLRKAIAFDFKIIVFRIMLSTKCLYLCKCSRSAAEQLARCPQRRNLIRASIAATENEAHALWAWHRLQQQISDQAAIEQAAQAVTEADARRQQAWRQLHRHRRAHGC